MLKFACQSETDSGGESNGGTRTTTLFRAGSRTLRDREALAAQLRGGTAEERKQLYGKLYDEMYRRVPHHPQLIRKVSPAETQIDLFRNCGFEPVTIYSSFRGHTFRVPTRPLLAFERCLVRQPPQRARAFLRRSLLRKLIDNCRLVAVKSGVAPTATQ